MPRYRSLLAAFLSVIAMQWTTIVWADSDLAVLRDWVGLYPHDRVRGHTFLDDQEIVAGIISALGPSAIAQLKSMAIVGPILRRGDWIIAYGCWPHMCGDGKWWVALNLASSEVRACLALPGSPTIRLGASQKRYVDLPRGPLNGACPEPEKAIPHFYSLLGVSVPSEETPRRPSSHIAGESQIRVPLTKDGGTYGVPVEINGALILEFVVDSGATDVTVPADVFLTLVRTGTIETSDVIGEQTYILADGSKLQGVTFKIRSLKVGGTIVRNIKGSVANANGMLLLGQSFLERFKTWSVDNVKHELVLELP